VALHAVPHRFPSPPRRRDRIVVVGGAANTLDILRLATVRSDEVVLIAPRVDSAIRRYVEHFGVDLRQRPVAERDLAGASAALVAAEDEGAAERAVWAARRHGVPVHVSNRPDLSDFTLIDMLERQPSSFAETASAIA